MTNVALIDVLTSLILTCLTGLEDADRVAINTGPEGEAQDFYPYDECVALALQIVEQHRELVLHIFYPNHPKEDLSKKSTSEDRRIAIRLAELAQAFAVPIYLSVLQHVGFIYPLKYERLQSASLYSIESVTMCRRFLEFVLCNFGHSEPLLERRNRMFRKLTTIIDSRHQWSSAHE
jgi:hypothetical protein